MLLKLGHDAIVISGQAHRSYFLNGKEQNEIGLI
jgi:hypothetical protein